MSAEKDDCCCSKSHNEANYLQTVDGHIQFDTEFACIQGERSNTTKLNCLQAAVGKESDNAQVVDRTSDCLHADDDNSRYLHGGDRENGYLKGNDRDNVYLLAGDKDSSYIQAGDRDNGYLHGAVRDNGYLKGSDRDNINLLAGDRNSSYIQAGDKHNGYNHGGDRDNIYLQAGDNNSGYLYVAERESGYHHGDYRDSSYIQASDRDNGRLQDGNRDYGYLQAVDRDNDYLQAVEHNDNGFVCVQSVAFNERTHLQAVAASDLSHCRDLFRQSVSAECDEALYEQINDTEEGYEQIANYEIGQQQQISSHPAPSYHQHVDDNDIVCQPTYHLQHHTPLHNQIDGNEQEVYEQVTDYYAASVQYNDRPISGADFDGGEGSNTLHAIKLPIRLKPETSRFRYVQQ